MASQEKDLERGPETRPPPNNPASPTMVDLAPRVNIPSISSHPMSNNPAGALPNFYGRDSTLSPPSQQRPGLPHRFSALFTENNPNLEIFRLHLGISDDESFKPAQGPVKRYTGIRQAVQAGVGEYIQENFTSQPTNTNTGRAAANLGIYQRVIAAETKYAREYKLFAFLINGALGLQIIFAAALTALGAGDGPHGAVTAFGAMNTVIAGFLTFLKGSGLPNRLRYNQNEWSRVREYIEQRERDFALDRSLTYAQVEEEIRKIEHVYEDVRKDIEANTPDNFVSSTNAMKALREQTVDKDSNNNNNNNRSNNNNINSSIKNEDKAHDGSRPQSYPSSVSQSNEKLGSIPEIIAHDSNGVQHRLSGGLGGLSDTFQNIGKAYHNFGKGITSTTTEVTNQINDQATGVTKQATNTLVTLQRSASDLRKTAQDQATEAGKQAENTISHAQHSADNAIRQTEARMREAEDQASSSATNLQHTAEDMITRTQTSAQTAVSGAEHAAQSRFTESRQHAAEKMHETEDKIAMAIRHGVESGLSLLKHHEHKQG